MKFKLNSTTVVKFKSKIPSQAVTGPGIIGKRLPIMPIRQNRKPNINKNKSNLKLFLRRYCLLVCNDPRDFIFCKFQVNH